MANPSYYLEHISGGSTTIIQSGDIGRFRANKSITNKTGMGTFPIVNSDRRYDDLFSPYDEMRLYVDGVYAFGGHLNRIDRKKGLLDLRVVGYTDMLKWALTNEDIYDDNSGSQIVNTASVGLINKYYIDDANRKTIYTTNHVNGDTQETFYFETDGETVFDAIKRVASESRISGGTVPFDFYVDYFPASDQIELYFDVKNNAFSGITLNEGTDFYNTYALTSGDLDQVYNDVIVRGQNKTACPIDFDWWTADGGSYARTGHTKVVDTSVKLFGANSYKMDVDSGRTNATAQLGLKNAPSYSATYTPDSLFTSGSGYIFDQEYDNFLDIWFRMTSACESNLDDLSLRIYPDPGSSKKIYVYSTTAANNPLYESVNALEWFRATVNLNQNFPSDTEFIDTVDVRLDYASSTGSGEDLWFDKLHFYTNRTLETSASNDATSMTNYGKRTLLYSDSRIATLIAAEEKRTTLLNMYKNPGNTIKLPMIKSQPITGANAIELGETFVVRGNELNALTYRLREVNWSPEGQSLTGQLSTYYVDRDHSIGQFTRDIQGGLKEVQRRGP